MDQKEKSSDGKRSSEWVSVSDLDNLENEKPQQVSKSSKRGSIIFILAGIFFLGCGLYNYDKEPIETLEDGGAPKNGTDIGTRMGKVFSSLVG